MDTTYRLTQTGAEVQEALNQVPQNEQNIETLQSDKVDKVAGKGCPIINVMPMQIQWCPTDNASFFI